MLSYLRIRARNHESVSLRCCRSPYYAVRTTTCLKHASSTGNLVNVALPTCPCEERCCAGVCSRCDRVRRSSNDALCCSYEQASSHHALVDANWNPKSIMVLDYMSLFCVKPKISMLEYHTIKKPTSIFLSCGSEQSCQIRNVEWALTKDNFHGHYQTVYRRHGDVSLIQTVTTGRLKLFICKYFNALTRNVIRGKLVMRRLYMLKR